MRSGVYRVQVVEAGVSELLRDVLDYMLHKEGKPMYWAQQHELVQRIQAHLAQAAADPTEGGYMISYDPKPQAAAPEPVALGHKRACAAWTPMEACDCCLKERIALQTEQTMHAAWRKRAEEAEAELAAPASAPALAPERCAEICRELGEQFNKKSDSLPPESKPYYNGKGAGAHDCAAAIIAALTWQRAQGANLSDAQ